MTDIFTILPYGRNKKFIKFFNPTVAEVYYKSKVVDLISGKVSDIPATDFISKLNKISLETDKSIITHLFYEYGFLLQSNLEDLVNEDEPLAIFIDYQSVIEIDIEKKFDEIRLQNKKQVNFQKYKKAFETGVKNLYLGNCYQFNLTFLFNYLFKNSSIDDFVYAFMANKESLGSFAHLTYLGPWKKAILSNSPESLFQSKKTGNKIKIQTAPIKGTVKLGKKVDVEHLWQNLDKDPKNQAELYMITDLLRNDLNNIELPVAKVIKKKAPLLAPGILHQMSLIQVDVSSDVSLGQIVQALFPGGSITGAPKKRVLQILHELEESPRGIYCGSTILMHRERCDASINIRTAFIDFEHGELVYGAGGGITLLSDPRDEFQEMLVKRDSFIDLFFK